MKTTPLTGAVHATSVTDGELRLEQQIDYQERIQKELGLSLVWCGNCGAYQILPTVGGEHQCYYCGKFLDYSDFPDLFFRGMNYVDYELTF